LLFLSEPWLLPGFLIFLDTACNLLSWPTWAANSFDGSGAAVQVLINAPLVNCFGFGKPLVEALQVVADESPDPEPVETLNQRCLIRWHLAARTDTAQSIGFSSVKGCRVAFGMQSARNGHEK
jgi:hypothetical protein